MSVTAELNCRVVGQPKLPELEHLSLQLAAAGVTMCETNLEPVEKPAVQMATIWATPTGRQTFWP
jgi:serine/threonine-protein kinase HipA